MEIDTLQHDSYPMYIESLSDLAASQCIEQGISVEVQD